MRGGWAAESSEAVWSLEARRRSDFLSEPLACDFHHQAQAIVHEYEGWGVGVPCPSSGHGRFNIVRYEFAANINEMSYR
jgi:hypothetical protein